MEKDLTKLPQKEKQAQKLHTSLLNVEHVKTFTKQWREMANLLGNINNIHNKLDAYKLMKFPG